MDALNIYLSIAQRLGYELYGQISERVVSELDLLTERYEILPVSFMDNLLPSRDLEGLFTKITRLGKDLRLFAEIRAITSAKELAAMAAAGMREVQVGIESLSSGLLKKLNKGTRAIDNLQIMKNCETPGLPDLTGNLIVCFPSSDECDVTETLASLEFAFPFRPLKEIPFWLGYGSPVWHTPAAYDIRRVYNHPHYRYLFPAEVIKTLQPMIRGYQGGARYQKRI